MSLFVEDILGLCWLMWVSEKERTIHVVSYQKQPTSCVVFAFDFAFCFFRSKSVIMRTCSLGRWSHVMWGRICRALNMLTRCIATPSFSLAAVCPNSTLCAPAYPALK